MHQKLIKVSESLKVKYYFDKALTNNTQIQLWIPISVDEKKIINTKIDNINDKEIILTTSDKITDFKVTDVIFCHFDEQKVVFKSIINYISEFKISIRRPSFVLQKEFRSAPRIDLTDEHIFSSYQIGIEKIVKNNSIIGKAQVLDQSDNGIALNIKKDKLSHFYIQDKITLKIPSIDNTLKIGTIVHITQFSQESYTLGICFD